MSDKRARFQKRLEQRIAENGQKKRVADLEQELERLRSSIRELTDLANDHRNSNEFIGIVFRARFRSPHSKGAD